jgi:hypothetical protein
MLPGTAPAAPMDGSAPMLCALSVPPFVRINVPQRILSSVDGARTSPTTSVQRTNGYLMIRGMHNERVWGAVIEEQTGQMTATVGEHDGATVMSAMCIAP